MGSRLDKNSDAVRKRIEAHKFTGQDGEEYSASTFGGFGDYMRRKKLKLQNLDAEIRSQSDKPQIFRGVVCHVNGYTQPSLNDLHKMIVQHGGGFLQYLDGKTTVTHIIASSLTPKKAVEFKRYRIVKPAWVVDSIKAGKLLPWHQFRVLDEGAGQRVIGFDSSGKVVGEHSGLKRGYRDQTDNSWYTSQIRSGSQRPVWRSTQPLPTPDKTDSVEEDIEEIDDELQDIALPPISTQKLSQLPQRTIDTRQSPVSPKSSPDAPQETPQLIRDLRKIGSDSKEQPPDSSPLNGKSQAPSNSDNHDLSGLDLSVGSRTQEELAQLPESDGPHPAEAQNPTEDSKEQSNPAANPPADTEKTPDYRHLAQDVPSKAPSKREIRNDVPYSDDRHPVNIPYNENESADHPSKRRKLTAEEHNEILLQDPRIWKSSVVNPDFLEQYYSESRLHHLSTWKADLKSQLQRMAEERSATQKARMKPNPKARRYIMHVDFDSFFAAVSLKSKPSEFKELPCVVAHGSGSGSEIASCNYPARKFGISNGMWMKRALELCPKLEILPYDFPAYEEASRGFYEAIISTGGIVQSVSVDEALVDISTLCFAAVGGDGVKRHEGTVYREQDAADKIASKLRNEVREKTGCEVSVGIGANILQAKCALRKAKPAGQYQLRPEDVLDFMGGLEVIALPGVAYSIAGKLEDLGIKLVKDIRECTKEKLMTSLGPKTGEKLWEYARGIDRKEVGDVEVRKSVSAEVNWGVRFYNQEQVDEFILNLCGELTRRLIKERVKGKQLSLKIMKRSADAPLEPPKHMGHGKCDTFNKSVLLGVATNTREVLAKETLSMLKSLGFSPGELRGIGVQMTRLEPLRAANAPGQVESSQRRLQFKFGEAKKPVQIPKVQEEDSIQEDEPPPANEIPIQQDDPIEDIVMPKKPKAPPDKRPVDITPDKPRFGAPELAASTPSRKPLNTLGTQFILPSQVDPAVLAELPEDIRTKLAKHMKTVSRATQGKLPAPATKPIAKPPQAGPKVFTALPAESQIDQDMLKALPSDVRAEVLAFYNKDRDRSPSKPKVGEQAILPQSPRTVRTVRHAIPAPTKRRGRPGKFDVRANLNHGTLTQSNFIALSRHGSPNTTDHESNANLDTEFLAALPEDIRRELLDEQRRKRLAKMAGIQVSARHHIRNPAPSRSVSSSKMMERRVVRLPSRPGKPVFTGRKISSLEGLREAISEWVKEFREDGPYGEDTEALVKYLGKVVVEEGDMGKVIGAVRWLEWCVEEELGEEGDAVGQWREALGLVRQGVQAAVKSRGLGAVKF